MEKLFFRKGMERPVGMQTWEGSGEGMGSISKGQEG
jgi:hypothetical protein